MSKHLSVDVASVYLGPPTTLATITAVAAMLFTTAGALLAHSMTLKWACEVSLHAAVVAPARPQRDEVPVVAVDTRTAPVPGAPHVATSRVADAGPERQHK